MASDPIHSSVPDHQATSPSAHWRTGNSSRSTRISYSFGHSFFGGGDPLLMIGGSAGRQLVPVPHFSQMAELSYEFVRAPSEATAALQRHEVLPAGIFPLSCSIMVS